MERQEIIRKAISMLTDEEKFILFGYYLSIGCKTIKQVIGWMDECYIGEENMTAERVYKDCLETVADVR